MTRFITYTLIITLLLGLGTYLLIQAGWIAVPSYRYPTLVALSLLTMIPGAWILRTAGSEPEAFVRAFLTALVIRLLTAGLFVFAVIFLDSQGATTNAAYFLAVYFVLTVFETGYLFREVQGRRPQKDR